MLPYTIVSENGTTIINSHEFKRFSEVKSTAHLKTALDHLTNNSVVENAVKSW